MKQINWIPICGETGTVGFASKCSTCEKIIEKEPSHNARVIAVVCQHCGSLNKVTPQPKVKG